MWLYGVHGTVSDVKKWSETHVSASSTSDNNNHQLSVNSTVEDAGEFWVTTAGGRQEIIKEPLAVRESQEVTMVWGNLQNISSGNYILFRNYTTGRDTSFTGRLGSANTPLFQAFAEPEISAYRKKFRFLILMLVITITVLILLSMNNSDGAPHSFAGHVVGTVIIMLVPLVILALIVTAIKFNKTKKRLLQQLRTELATVSRSALANPAFMRDVS
ncbi:hypothetical protein CFR73_09970 [Novacetimonas maltaceti]|nr:hypothetical protein CFR73_09970 [Novacetimonas maltaceti]